MVAFVVEGIDRVGKSTLIEKLRIQYRYQTVSIARPSENGWDSHIREFRKGKDDAKKVCDLAKKYHERVDWVLDRFSYSEIVYSRAFQRPCDFGWYEAMLKKNKDLFRVIYVVEDHETLEERWLAEDKPVNNIPTILAEYQQVFNKLGLKNGSDIIRFQPTKNSVGSLVRWMNRHGKDSLRPSTQLL